MGVGKMGQIIGEMGVGKMGVGEMGVIRGIMSSVWDMILKRGSTIKVSIELPVATRHRRDMTEKLLKATLNPNTHTHRGKI